MLRRNHCVVFFKMKLFTLLIALKCVLSLPAVFLSNQDKLNVGFQGPDIFLMGVII